MTVPPQGNGLSALGGLLAFTVVLSVAVSVLAALTFLSASASDATGTFINYMARCGTGLKQGVRLGLETGMRQIASRGWECS